MAYCFKALETHSIGTLSSLDCNKTIILFHSALPSRTCQFFMEFRCTIIYLPLVFLFPKLGVIHGEEHLSIPVVDSTATQQNRRANQILNFLAAAGMTAGVAPGTQGWPPPSPHTVSSLPSLSMISTASPNQTHSPRTDRFPGSSSALKLTGTRPSYSYRGWPFPFSPRMLLLRQPVGFSKEQNLTTTNRPPKKY